MYKNLCGGSYSHRYFYQEFEDAAVLDDSYAYYARYQKTPESDSGFVLAGVIESVGKDVKRFKAGDSVYGLTGFRFGAYAEYICLKEKDSKARSIALKPQNISYEEATAKDLTKKICVAY